jgi:hypothetical protein
VFANAVKARAQELARIGLAKDVRRNVLRFERGGKGMAYVRREAPAAMQFSRPAKVRCGPIGRSGLFVKGSRGDHRSRIVA